MAYNLLAYRKEDIDWAKLNETLVGTQDDVIEYFPIIDKKTGFKGLGISIPSGNMNKLSWDYLKERIKTLIDFGFTLFDMYSGNEIPPNNLDVIKKNLFS